MKDRKERFRLSYKITLMLVVMVVLCSVSVGVFVYGNFARELYALKGMTAQTAADTLAAALDPMAIRKLDETETEDAYYYHLRDVLIQAGKRTRFNFLYVLTLTDGGENFKVIYGQDAPGTFSHPLGHRDPVSIWNEAALRCFTTGEHTYSQPYYAEGFGDLMSGYSPLPTRDGEVIAIVGLDIPLSDITAQLASMRTSIAVIVAAFVVLFSIVSMVWTKARIGNPVMKLSRLSENIVAGNLDYDVNIASGDEIGVLADDLLKVRTILGNLNSEVSTLVRNAAGGQMNARASASAYTGDWGALLGELNHLLDTLNVPIDYAGTIQRNLLPEDATFREAFSDYSVLWSPRDIVGGDIYWMKNFSGGSVLCVCDCTGHGTPGALLTMLVVSVFDSMITEENCTDTARIVRDLEERLVSVFGLDASGAEGGKKVSAEIQEGCDLAVLFIAKDGSVTVSAGNLSVFVCDGAAVRRFKGQRIHVGEGKIRSAEDVETVRVPANPANKFYIASDGLYDQIGGANRLPFGYETFRRIVLENHGESQGVISERIREAFEAHRGSEARRDDVELITFRI
jgi:HAMP domain-containing protein